MFKIMIKSVICFLSSQCVKNCYNEWLLNIVQILQYDLKLHRMRPIPGTLLHGQGLKHVKAMGSQGSMPRMNIAGQCFFQVI